MPRISRHSELLESVANALDVARKSFERRLFVVLGDLDRTEEAIVKVLENVEMDSVLITSNFKRLHKRLNQVVGGEKSIIISNWATDKILGRTYDLAVIDLRDWPDVIALSRVIGTVRGGGLIFLLLPLDYKTRTYYEEIVPPFCKKQPRKIMLERMIKKSIKCSGVYVYDADKEIFLWKPKEKVRHYEKKKIEVPKGTLVPRKIYELAATRDQMNVLKLFENWEHYIILLANRGRGKSASIGLGLTGYATLFVKKHKRPLFVCLTSRSILNVEEIFRFAEIAHEALGIKYEFSGKDNAFKSDLLRLEFEMPHRAIKMAHIADALVVDEVAAIPFPFLRRTIEAYKKIVFSGTVHGYEGTGRVFAVRFLKMLEKSKKEFHKIELEEPIRYAENDPVEKWLFDLLLLDAEPLPVDDKILEDINKARLIEIDPKKYFLGDDKYERFLRSLIGILTTAHYRNNPKDLLLMSDAPHHRMFALVINSIPVVALQIAEEGEVPEDKIQELIEKAPSGHLIPDNVTRYTGLLEIPTLKGFRIVRIATHPSLQGRGLGSLALKKLSERARKEGAMWVGASFGANPQLLNFWLKNKFIVANMSPMVNPKTGEYSVIVMKPLTKRARRLILEANKQLKIRLLRELRNSYWELETETAHMILKKGSLVEIIPHLNTGDVFRLGLYTQLGGKIEACIDVIDEIVKIYFARQYSFLSKKEEILLVKKICQRRLIEKEELIKIRRIVRKLWEHIIRVKIKDKEHKSIE